MLILAKAMSVTFIVLFTYAMLSSYLLRRFIDERKSREHNYERSVFYGITPPPRILTAVGVKIWWSKWISLALSLVALSCSIFLYKNKSEAEKRGRASEINPPSSKPSQ
jgi:hypothetical protein